MFIEYKDKILEYFCVEFMDFMLKGIPMDTSLSILHRFDVEISCGKFVEITSKRHIYVEIMNRFDVEISTWIRLSKLTKYQ